MADHEVDLITHQPRRDGHRASCGCGWCDSDDDIELLDALVNLHDLLFCDDLITVEEHGVVR